MPSYKITNPTLDKLVSFQQLCNASIEVFSTTFLATDLIIDKVRRLSEQDSISTVPSSVLNSKLTALQAHSPFAEAQLLAIKVKFLALLARRTNESMPANVEAEVLGFSLRQRRDPEVISTCPEP